MISAIWKVVENSTSDLVDKFIQLAQDICNNPSENDIVGLQSGVIELGTALENEYGLQNTDIINLLEKCCEDIYEYGMSHDEARMKIILEEFDEILPILRKCVTVKDIDLAVTAIMKNEGKYVVEWIEYHLMVGVEHFYIYDNESEDDLQQLLKGYIDRGIVTYHYWPGRVQQLATYNHAIEKYKNDTKWMAFIDADEFMVPVSKETIPEVIDEIMRRHRKLPAVGEAAGIGVNWRAYGTSFHKEEVDGLITKNYVYCGNMYSMKNICIKTICDPRRVMGFTANPHQVDYKDVHHYTISENGSYIMGPWFYDSICNRIRINHYFSKSTEEFVQRLNKGRADSHVVFPPEWIEQECERAEVEYDEVYCKTALSS